MAGWMVLLVECRSMGGLGRGRCEKRETILSSPEVGSTLSCGSSFFVSSLGLRLSSVEEGLLSFLSAFDLGLPPPSAWAAALAARWLSWRARRSALLSLGFLGGMTMLSGFFFSFLGASVAFGGVVEESMVVTWLVVGGCRLSFREERGEERRAGKEERDMLLNITGD